MVERESAAGGDVLSGSPIVTRMPGPILRGFEMEIPDIQRQVAADSAI